MIDQNKFVQMNDHFHAYKLLKINVKIILSVLRDVWFKILIYYLRALFLPLIKYSFLLIELVKIIK